MSSSKTLYLLDANSLIFQVFHAIPAMTGPKGQPTNAVFGFTGDLLRLRRRKPDYLVCVFDPPGKTFRDELYPEYKAQRAPMPEDLAAQWPLILRVLEALRVPVVMVEGYEADDAIATLARKGEQQGIDVFVCTSDKDMRQLITDRIRIFNLRRDQVLDREALWKEWGITPEQVVDFLTLVGDQVDNVPGVPGVGPKTATKLLQEYGDLDNLLAHVDEIKQPKLRENLGQSAEQLRLGRDLITLKTDVPVEPDWHAWKLQPLNVPAILDVFRECGFRRYTDEVLRLAEEETGTVFPVAAARQKMLFGQQNGSGEGRPTAPSDSWQAEYHLVNSPGQFRRFLGELRDVRRFALDVETTSLDPHQAAVVGLAFCWRAGEAHYLCLKAPPEQPTLEAEEVFRELRPILENPSLGKVNQNIKYDIQVLRTAGIRLAGIDGDSMVASYLLTSGERNHNLEELSLQYLGHQPIPISDLIGTGKNQRSMDAVDPSLVARYAGEDADIAWRLIGILEPKLAERGLERLYRDVEVPLIDVLAELEYNGVKVDVPLLKRLSEDFSRQLAALEQEIHALAGHPFNIGSPKQLRQVLFEELRLPARRKTSITGEASTGQEVLEELAAAGHELPQKILEYRQIAKLKSTYVDALPAMVNPVTGRVHAAFNQTVTATGRLSSSDPNLQNIPIRTALGRQIRQAFIADPQPWQLLTADYSQIELRVLAHFSQDAELQRAFQEDRDIHAHVAAQIYGVAEDQVTPEQRRNAKTVNFGVIYGLSAYGLAQRLGMENEEAAAFIDAYFARYPGVLAFQEEVLEQARRQGFVTTILGRRRAIEGVRPQSSYKQRNQPEREALNTVIQGSAADLIKAAMVRIHRRMKHEGFTARMLLQIHDELIFEAPPEELRRLAQLVDQEMTQALPLRVPIKVDLAFGPNWLDTQPLAA
ncbi:MAG: DNA polymerase I [Gemmatales bacterium]|nr:DNA polymerase I [Gemmatales bacterium]MDW8387594.1 DNA polymerase I [Gemmatales bacterium]